MTQQVFHNNVNFLINKAQGGYYSPSVIDERQQMAQISIFNDFVQDYQKTGVINSALLPFMEEYFFTRLDTAGGVISAPTGYLYTTDLQTVQFNNTYKKTITPSVKFFKKDELGDALGSQVCEPTAINPIASEQKQGKIQLYPKQPQTGTLFYLRLPVKPFFSFTQAGRVITYIPSTATTNPSIDPEWRDTEINLVILKTVELLGINLSSPALVQKVGSDIANNFSSPVKA